MEQGKSPAIVHKREKEKKQHRRPTDDKSVVFKDFCCYVFNFFHWRKNKPIWNYRCFIFNKTMKIFNQSGLFLIPKNWREQQQHSENLETADEHEE